MRAESAKKTKISDFQQKANSGPELEHLGPEFHAPVIMFIRKKIGPQMGAFGRRIFQMGNTFLSTQAPNWWAWGPILTGL